MCLSIFLQYTVKVEKGDYVLKLQVGNRDIFVKRYHCFIHQKPPARDMCSAPFRLINKWSKHALFMFQRYLRAKIIIIFQNAFFSSCSWAPIAPTAGFLPLYQLFFFFSFTLTISCSSGSLDAYCCFPAIQTSRFSLVLPALSSGCSFPALKTSLSFCAPCPRCCFLRASHLLQFWRAWRLNQNSTTISRMQKTSRIPKNTSQNLASGKFLSRVLVSGKRLPTSH